MCDAGFNMQQHFRKTAEAPNPNFDTPDDFLDGFPGVSREQAFAFLQRTKEALLAA